MGRRDSVIFPEGAGDRGPRCPGWAAGSGLSGAEAAGLSERRRGAGRGARVPAAASPLPPGANEWSVRAARYLAVQPAKPSSDVALPVSDSCFVSLPLEP